jgi:predicted Zn-dependent protease
MSSRSWFRSIVIAAGALIAGHCSSGSVGFNIFPDTKDIELGRQVDTEIRKTPQEYPILQGRPDVKAYVEEIGQRILASPEIKKKGVYAYQFEIIHDDKTINAFCTPGGYIYVYTGLLKFLENEAALAGVIGHEIAHAERRHATRRMTTQLGYQMLISIVLGDTPGQAAQIAGNLFTGLALLKNSRGDETESDTYSFKYLRSTPYYPGAIKYFFEKVQGESRGSRGGSFERLLSTHPLPQDRFDHINRMLAEIGDPAPTEANLFGQRYLEFRSKLP